MQLACLSIPFQIRRWSRTQNEFSAHFEAVWPDFHRAKCFETTSVYLDASRRHDTSIGREKTSCPLAQCMTSLELKVDDFISIRLMLEERRLDYECLTP